MLIGSSRKAASHARDRLAVEAIGSLPALDALRDEWQALALRSGARPFQWPAWLLPWMRHVGTGEVASIAVRDGGSHRLLGLAPLYVYRDEKGVRHLFPMGIATTDSLDVLCEPGREDDVLRAFVSHIASPRAAWDLLEAPQLDASSLLLRCRWPADWRHDVSQCEPNPVVALDAPLPAGFAKRLGIAQRRIARAGRVEYEWARADRIEALLGDLARLHASRWATRGLPGVLRGQGVIDWHRECALALHAHGLLRLAALKFDGQVIGMVYAICDAGHVARRRWYSYIGGFDPAFSRFSPGTLLIGHFIERARQEGAAFYDFLRGAEAYKHRWGAVDQPMFTLLVTR